MKLGRLTKVDRDRFIKVSKRQIADRIWEDIMNEEEAAVIADAIIIPLISKNGGKFDETDMTFLIPKSDW